MAVDLVAPITLDHGAALFRSAYSADFPTSMQTQAMPRQFRSRAYPAVQPPAAVGYAPVLPRPHFDFRPLGEIEPEGLRSRIRPKAAGISGWPLRLGRHRSSHTATLACAGNPDIVEANELLSFLTLVNKPEVVVKRAFYVGCRPCGDQKPVLLISIPPQQGFLTDRPDFPAPQ